MANPVRAAAASPVSLTYTAGRLTWPGGETRAVCGRGGVRADKREGDGASPEGIFPLLYGFYRAEILAALVNSIALLGVAAWILYAAWQRLNDPHPVLALPMLIIACGGLVVTLVGALLLHRGAAESLNVRGLYPAGEGAGYAGGIMSAGVDGIEVAEAVARSILGLPADASAPHAVGPSVLQAI